MHADSIKPFSSCTATSGLSRGCCPAPSPQPAPQQLSCTAGEQAALCRGDSALVEPICVTVIHSLGLFLTGLLGFLFIEVLVQQQMQMSDLHPA